MKTTPAAVAAVAGLLLCCAPGVTAQTHADLVCATIATWPTPPQMRTLAQQLLNMGVPPDGVAVTVVTDVREQCPQNMIILDWYATNSHRAGSVLGGTA